MESAIKNVNKKTVGVLKIVVIIVAIGIFLGTILLVLAKQQINKVSALQQELQSLELAQESSEDLTAFIESQGENIPIILDVFPDEENIIDFLSTLEAVVKSYDAQGEVNFSALTPNKINDELAIPLVIAVKITPLESLELLKSIELLPYVIRITSVEMNTTQGLQEKAEITLGGRVYVKDPFR